MKMPKTKKRYCPYCKKHTEHKVSQSKKRAASSLTAGSKYRMSKRGKCTGMGNKGKISKGAMSRWKRSTKKTYLRYECSVCKKSHEQSKGFRAKKLEFT